MKKISFLNMCFFMLSCREDINGYSGWKNPLKHGYPYTSQGN